MYELVKMEELSETGHDYQIFNTEEIKKLEKEWADWSVGREVIEVAKSGMYIKKSTSKVEENYLKRAIDKGYINPNKAVSKIRTFINEIQAMHCKIKRLRDKAVSEQQKATELRKEYEKLLHKEVRRRDKAEQTKPLIEQKITIEYLRNLENISGCKVLSQNPEVCIQQLSTICEDMSTQILDLKRENAVLKKELEKERELKKIDYQVKKHSARRLERAVREVAKSKIEVQKTIVNRARKAGKAKQSPYAKAGTIAAVNALLAENKQLLAERGGKAKLNRMIMDLIAENQIPAPDTPTQKTVDSWIDKFKNTEMN